MKVATAAAQSRVGAGWAGYRHESGTCPEREGGYKNQYEYCGKGKFRVDISDFRTLNMSTPLIAFRRNRTHVVFDAMPDFLKGII
jgi:hypothetical protein